MKEGFREKLQETFRAEASEHVRNISSALGDLGRAEAGDMAGAVDGVFREAHSLKGSARVVGMKEIESVCRPLEDCLAALGNGKLAMSPALLDSLTLAVDTLARLLPATGRECTNDERAGTTAAIQALNEALQGRSPSLPRALPTSPPSSPAPAETLRIASSTLESVLLQTSELIPARLAARRHAQEMEEASRSLGQWSEQWRQVSADAGRLRFRHDRASASEAGSQDRQLGRLLDFVEWNAGFLASARVRVAALAGESRRDARELDRTVDSLQAEMKRTLMSSFASLVEAFPSFVRELARAQKKEVQIDIRGEETEIDRRILDALRDPLTHIVRNCVDHGIEEAAERRRLKKPPCGRISFSIARRGTSQAEILVSDDGAGIDFDAVREAAVRSGGISRAEAKGAAEASLISFVFRAGISTRRTVTDISGRGLGLAIARQKVESVRGTISLESRRGLGSTFRIIVPMSLADFRGVIVQAGRQAFVIPLVDVERALRVARGDISTIENRTTITLGARVLPLVRLDDVLGVPRQDEGESAQAHVSVIVVGRAELAIAFVVQEILGEQEVLVKPLGRHLACVRNVAGVTTLSDGKKVPVLHAPDLLVSAGRASAGLQLMENAPAPARRARLLVVEDSITARTLLRNILETAGYWVETAVDGAEAFAKLAVGQFDCVVSDVDMPRMNGFDLTAKIRADARLSDLPVVLVTALESREQWERGVEAGANAYILKSDFEQDNLLEVVRRMT